MNRANADAIIAVTASPTMDLAGKYDKLNLLGDGEVQVWRGRERSRGTPVLLHTFTGSPNLLRLAAQYLFNRPPGSPLLDIGEWEGATCLVTVSELDLLDIGAWLQNAVSSSPIAAPAPAPRPAPAAPPPMPGVADSMTQRVPAAGPVAIPRADSAPAPKPAPSPGPGEFTRAFQLPGSNVPPPPLQDPMASAAPAKPAAGPGEFTRMFQLPSQAGNRETTKLPEMGLPPSPPPPPAPSTPSAGEFTRLFRAHPIDSPPRDFPVSGGAPQQTFPSPELPPEPVAPKLSIVTGPVAVPERSAPPVPKGPGEYTRMIQTQPLQATAPQASVSPSPASAQAVQLPLAVSVTPAIPSVPAPPALPSVSVPSVPSVPSIPSVPASLAAPSGQRSGISPVVLLLGGLILVAVILVLVFALRR